VQVVGCKTVTELENTMSIRELYEWYEYYSEEPFMADRIEIQLATISNIAGSFGGSKLKHSDYMISNKEKKKGTNDPDAIKNMFMTIGTITNEKEK
jgi:hypothetical protein